MNAEHRLRARIRRELAEMGFDRPQDSSAADEMVNQIYELFRAYLRVPDERRTEVYDNVKRQLVEHLRSARENQG